METARRLLALLPAVLLLLPPGTASGKQAGSPFTSTNPRLETVVVAVPADLPCARAERTGTRTSYLDCHSSGARHPDTPGGPEFLERYAEQLGLQVGLDNLQLVSEKNGLSGKTYRYIQTLGNTPIDGAWITVVTNRDGHVRSVHSSYKEVRGLLPRHPTVSAEDAELVAITIAGVGSLRLPSKIELVWLPTEAGGLRKTWRLVVYSAQPLADLRTLVDATTGKVIEQRDILVYADTGSGYVYLPNPLQVLGDPTLEDNDDATDSVLDSARSWVTLEGLAASTGRLIGEYADVTLDGGLGLDVADEATRVYSYDRDDPRFEDVVTYHSIDSIQRRFHALGFDDDTGEQNGIRDFPTKANTHWMEDDNAFYSTGNDALHFGDGGIDDAEDADVVAHEYGHAVQHDQNACWGGGEMGAMGEGFGDYLAAAFYSTAGNANYQADHAACVADWDATAYSGSSPPCLRRVDGDKVYPTDLSGEVHDDGEIWSAALWNIRAELGPDTADTLVLDHHFSLTCDATMRDAALEIIAVDNELSGGANNTAITQAFCDRGIFSNDDCPELAVSVATSPALPAAGDTITFTLTVTNTTDQTITGVALIATVPDGSSYSAGSASDGGYESYGNVHWTNFSLAAAASAVRTFSATVGSLSSSQLTFYDDVENGADYWDRSHGIGLPYHWTIQDNYGHTDRSSARSARSGDGDDHDHASSFIDTEGASACVGGYAGSFPCSNIDLSHWLTIDDIGGGEGNDIWGWTDPDTGREYAIMGRTTGTSFVDVTDPESPVYVGNLPSRSGSSTWRDMKVYANYAFIVSEAPSHGLQVFDLTELRGADPGTTFSTTAGYDLFSTAHNIAINEDTGYAYVVGSNTCSGGLHMIDISTPTVPVSAGCFGTDGYTHDVQCVVYDGPDDDHDGKEICFASNEDTLTVIDVTDKNNPTIISTKGYPTSGYTHQGWLTDDHAWFLFDDELDEQYAGFNTRTYIANIADLEIPQVLWWYTGETPAVDHNLYIVGDYAYETNYTAGLRVIDINKVDSGSLCEAGYLDVYPDNNLAVMEGAWSSYPFFASGTVVVSAIGGLAIVKPQLDYVNCEGTPPPPTPEGAAWFASDPNEVSDQYLTMASSVVIEDGAELRFWHSYATEDTYDGGVVEISTDNGITWNDLGDSMTENGYTDQISVSYDSPIAGRMAFAGNSGGYLRTTISLSSWAGQQARIRFRMSTDNSVSSTGWFVDNIEIVTESSLTLTANVTSNEGLSSTATEIVQISEIGGACGDGVVAGSNECDDGNTASGDGCSSTCLVEQCYACIGSPSTCTSTDGTGCDDGSYCNGTDSCSAGTCSVHSGPPCAADNECSDTCSELTRSCLVAPGDPCTSDGNPCTQDYCDEAGTCLHVFDNWVCSSTTTTSTSTTTTTTTSTTTSTTTTTTTTTSTTLRQTPQQQRCIIAMNKSGRSIAKRQGKENYWCVRGATKQSIADPATCIISDSRGKMLRAFNKASTMHDRKCLMGAHPDFGYGDAVTVYTAATSQEREMLRMLFGTDLTNAITTAENNAAMARCQTYSAKLYEKIVSTKLKEFLSCKTKGSKAALLTSPAMLKDCIGLSRGAKAEKAVQKLKRIVESRCLGIDRAAAFQGPCGTEPTVVGFVECANTLTDCGVCRMLAEMDGFEMDCDVFDNGTTDLSCP